MNERKLKNITYGLMGLTLVTIALGAIFPVGITSTYLGFGVPISVINIYLIYSFKDADNPTLFKKWARLIYLFYGGIFILFAVLLVIIGIIFSFGF
jgi:hypothetical protein